MKPMEASKKSSDAEFNDTKPDTKSSDAYRIISEVAELIGIAPSAIRFWGEKFKQLKPLSINNRRYYSAADIELLKTIKHLLHDQGYTIAGAVKYLKKQARASETPTQVAEQIESGAASRQAAGHETAAGASCDGSTMSAQLKTKLHELLAKAKLARQMLDGLKPDSQKV